MSRRKNAEASRPPTPRAAKRWGNPGGTARIPLVPGERSPNGTVDPLSRRPTLESYVNRSRVAHGESASAPVIWARCRPVYELAAKDRMSGCRRRGCRGSGPIMGRTDTILNGRHWKVVIKSRRWDPQGDDGRCSCGPHPCQENSSIRICSKHTWLTLPCRSRKLIVFRKIPCSRHSSL